METDGVNPPEAFLPAKGLSPAEKKIIEDYITIPLMRLAFLRDRKVIDLTNTKFKQQYLNMIDSVLNKLTQDQKESREGIFKKHIQVTKHHWLSYEFWVRGYVHKYNLTKKQANVMVQERLGEYLDMDNEG